MVRGDNMSKQDRQGVRTPAALERKYPFGDIERNKSNANNQYVLLNQLRNDLATYKKSVNGDIEKINQFMDEANAKFDDLEENDKMWFYSGVPTLENYPANEWTTDELKAKHMGDMYCDVDKGNMYIFKKIADAYLWQSCLSSGCDVDHDALYNEGYGKGYTEGETAGYNKGYADGQEGEPDMFEHAIFVQFPSLNIFGKPTVELNLSERLSSLQTFISTKTENDKNITVEHLTINSLGLPTSMSGFMQCNAKARDEKLKTLTLNFSTENIISYNNAFNGLMALEEINGIPLDFSSATVTATFTYCNSLKEVRFKANTIEKSISFAQCPNLSAETIQSIIDGLATVTTAQTITFHSSIVLTDEQKATISSKGWTLVQ